MNDKIELEGTAQIKITPLIETKTATTIDVDVEFTFQFLTVKEENGMLSSYIPAFDSYFYARNEEETMKVGGLMSETFSDHWIKQESFTSFLRQLRILGFEPGGGVLDWKNLLEKKRIKAPITFKPIKAKQVVPDIFVGSKKEEVKKHFALAY